jgi:quercetin dioxygenase-like cupin family protein
MTLVRRHFLRLAGAAAVLPAAARIAAAQGAPKLTQILRGDLQGQGEKVQETIVSVLELPPGVGAPWHMHPGAQELLFVIEGTLMIEVEGKGMQTIKAGEVGLIPAEIPHLARNENTAMVKALITHSRADKDKPLTVVVKRST